MIILPGSGTPFPCPFTVSAPHTPPEDQPPPSTLFPGTPGLFPVSVLRDSVNRRPEPPLCVRKLGTCSGTPAVTSTPVTNVTRSTLGGLPSGSRDRGWDRVVSTSLQND